MTRSPVYPTIQQLVEVFTMLLQFIEICGMLQDQQTAKLLLLYWHSLLLMINNEVHLINSTHLVLTFLMCMETVTVYSQSTHTHYYCGDKTD